LTSEPQVVCIGACTLDLIAAIEEPLGDDQRVKARDAVLGAGGPSATAAVALARLGIRVAFAGTVGDDPAGRFIREGLEAEGVDAAALLTQPGKSAMSPIWVSGRTGSRSIAAFYGTVGSPSLDEAVVDRCRAARWVHVDHVGFATVAALRAAGVGTPVSVDGGNPISGFELSEVDLYAPTAERILERYPDRSLEEAIVAALGEGPQTVVVTRGAQGSVAAVSGPEEAAPIFHRAPPFAVQIASTLGAGDVFHGALLAALVRGLELPSALRYANVAAALSCRALDGRSAIPTWEALEDTMRTSRHA
jgi:sulfofructose kinase